MGNVIHRNKEFQSVAPYPVESNGNKTPSPTRKKSMLKTAPAPELESPVVSPVVIITHDASELTAPTASQSSIATARQEPPVNEAVISIDNFDFRQTETQLRRKGMADCEFECSQITSYLFVGGYHVAGNWELLKSNGITRIVNCSNAVVSNHFISDPSMSYYSINMVDGRQDDIFWFLCDVIQFVIKGRTMGEKTLIHCEKGISRSCSYAIAYRMWSSGEKWKTSFDYVKERRPVCSPNTAFTCNLIELGEIFSGEMNTRNLIFRCAFHLPHDPLTAVLKLCRNTESRKIVPPSTSLLDPKGVFVIRFTRDATNDQLVFIWKGSQASQDTLDKAKALTPQFYGIVTNTQAIDIIEEGQESDLFLSCITDDGKFGVSSSSSVENSVRPAAPYEDLYDNKPSMEAALQFQREHEQMRITRDRPVMLNSRQTSIQGFDTSSENEYFKNDTSSHAPPSDFKLSKIPSLKFSIEPSVIGSRELVGSRRNSHSKPVVLSRASSIRRDSKTEVDMRVMSSDGYTTGSSVTASKDLSLNLALLTSGTQTNDSPLSGLRRSEDSPLAVSAKNRKYGEPIKEVLSPPETARDSARDSAREGVDDADLINSSRSNGTSLPSARQNLIDKISLEIDITPRDGPILTTTTTTTSSSSGAESKVPSLAISKSPVIEKLQIPSINAGQRVKEALALNLSTPTVNDEKTTTESHVEVPPVTARHPRFQDVENNDNNNNKDDKIDMVKHAETTNTTTSGTSGDVPVVMTKNSSRSRLLNLISGGTSERPSSASDPHKIFRNNSRILPLSGIEASPRTNTNNTAGIADERRHSLKEDLNLRPTINEGHRVTSPVSPAVDRMVKTDMKTPDNTPVKPSLASLQLPAGSILRSPSVEKHPENVSLSRGPTPAEDLAVPLSHRIISPSHSTHKITATPIKASAPEMVKPFLYQAVVKKSSKKRGESIYEWQAMGVYDDGDLDDTLLLLLLCPDNSHFVWVGAEFDCDKAGILIDEEADTPSESNVIRWCSGVLNGDVKFDGMTGKNLNKRLHVCRSGEETEDFWTQFNNGY